MHHEESSERPRVAAFASDASLPHYTDTLAPHQVYSDTGASHQSRVEEQGHCEEEVSIRRGEEEDTSRVASTQSCGERSSMSAATFARSGGAASANVQVEGSVYTPHRTSPHPQVALPSSVSPAIRLPTSPAGYLRPISLTAEGAACNPKLAVGGGGATAPHSEPAVCDVKVRERDMIDSSCPSGLRCRICGVSVLRTDWEMHQKTALHQRRLRECAIACGSCSSSSSHPLTVVVQGGSISPPAATEGFRVVQRPAISGDTQRAPSSARPSAGAPVLSREDPQGRSQTTAVVERRPSSRPHSSWRKPDSASSNTASSIYSTSSSSASRSSSSSRTRGVSSGSAGSAPSRSTESKSSPARGHSDVSAIHHVTPSRPTGQDFTAPASSSTTPSFALPPVSPPHLSAVSSVSAVACAASLPVKVFDPNEASVTAHYVEFTEEEQERQRVRKLEKKLRAYFYRHEHKVLAGCMRRWYEAMFTKATAPITDSYPLKRGGGAEVVTGAPCSREGCTVTLVPPESAGDHRIAALSLSPPFVSEVALSSVDASPYRQGVASVPADSTRPAVLEGSTSTAFPSNDQGSFLHNIAEERAVDRDGLSLARRSNTQQPPSRSGSMPHCGEDRQVNRPAGAGEKPNASQVIDANLMRTEHAGVLVTRGEDERIPAPFLTTSIKSYARVHATADGCVSPAEACRGSRGGNAESEPQELEVMQTKVSWVVRPSSRLAAACSSSSDSSDSIAARRGLRSAVGCSDTSGGVRAAAAACENVPNSSYPSANSPDVEATWGKTRVESSGWRDSDRGQPHHATKGEFLTVPAGRPHLLQPHSGTFHNAARYDRHEDHDGDAGTHDAGGALASEDPPEQQLGEPRHRRYGRKYKQSDTTKSEEWRPVPRKKCRGNAGDEKTENDCVSLRTQTSDEEAEERLRESSPLTSEAARRRHAVPRRLATPFGNSSSMRDEASLRQSSSAAKPKAAPSKRDPSRHSGDPKGDHLNAASPSSPITHEGASRELSSSLSSSFSSPSSLSDSNGSDSDVAELVASLSPSTRQRARQLLRLWNAASLPAHFDDELKGTTHAPDSHQQHEPHLAAVTTPATQRLTNAFTAGQDSPEAQVGEEREAPLGHLPAFPLSASVPQMPQNVGVHGTAPATTPMADILSVMLTRVPGGDNDHATASVNNENSAAHGPHHHHYRPLCTRAAVQLPRTLLALYAMSLRAASRSVVAPPVDTFHEHVSDHDGDAVQPPLKQSVPLVINEANSEVGQPRSPSDHPYNLGGPTCSSISGRHGWGGFHPSLGAKLVGRESGGANEESMVAGLPSTERYDVCLSRAHEPATTSTHSIDEGRVQEGTGTPVGESSAVQGPLLTPSVRSQVKLEAMESSDEGLPMHTAEVAQSRSAISDATSGAACDTHCVHGGGAAAEERDVLGAAEAMGSDANEGQLVGGIAPAAASTSHAAAMWAPNSLPSATGSASTATRTGAGALVPSGTVPEHYKAVSDSPGVVLPSTNRLPTAPSSALSSGVPPSAKSADAIEPKSAPTQLHVDPLQGPMLNVDPAVERRPLSFDQNTCTATPITRADSKSGDSALLWPLHSGEGQYGVKATRGTPQSALRPTRGAVAPGFGAAWRDASGSSGTALVPVTESLNAPSYTTVVTSSRADGTGAFLYDLPSLTIPVLHAKGDRGSLGKDMPRRAYNQHLRERRFAKEATAEVAVATGSDNAPSSAPSSLLPAAECNQSSPETFAHPQQPTLGDHPPRPFRLPRMRDVEASVCNFDVNTFARSLTQQPSAAEAGASSDALPPTSADTAKTVSCLTQCLVPTAHPYCCATLKGAAGGEPNPRRDARIAASESAATALRSILPARAALGEGVEDSTLNRTSAPFTAVTPLPEEAEAALDAALDASPLSSSSSSYSHTSSVGVHPNRRQPHHRRYRDRSAAPQESQRGERKKRRSRQGSCGEGDASLGHHRQHRHHRGGCRHEKDGKHKTCRLPHRRHHCSREKQRLPRHREGRPQAENTGATAPPQLHHPLLSEPEAAPQQGHKGVRSCDAAYIAQGELRRGKDHYGQPAADHGDDATRATRRHPSHRCSGSKALHIRDDAGDDNAAPKRRRHQRHGERERTRGDRHCGQRMPSASILSKSSLSSRSIRSGSNVSSDGDSEMLSADFTRCGRTAAWVSGLQSKAGEVARGPGSGDILGEGKGEMGAPVRSPSDNVEHSVEAPLRQRMIFSETRPEERGAQPRSHREWGPETQDSRTTRADAYVPEISGSSANTKAGGDASSHDPMRGVAVGGKDACNTDSYQPPELVGSKQVATQELPGRVGDGTSLSRASPASASASGRHAPDAQAQCSVAHGSACASTEKLGRPRRPSADAVTTGMAREQDAANGQRALPQHGDVFYSDSAGRFHRVSGVELPRVLEGDMGWRTSPERSQSLCGRGRRPLYVVHNPAPSGCAIPGRQARRAWTITNPTNSLSCGRLNPYCSSCRAKYNLMFVDPQMRPVQWLPAHSAELDQMGDCRIHSGYIFGGGDTEAVRDTMLVQQRLRSKRMAAWPELPQSGRDRFIVHEEDLDGPLRQLAPPPQGHFVRIAYEEDMRLPVDKALRRRAPLATASARRSFAFSPSSALPGQPPRHSSPGDASGDALRFISPPARERCNNSRPSFSGYLGPSTIRSGTCSYDSYHRNPTGCCRSPRSQLKSHGSYNTKDTAALSITPLDKVEEAATAERREFPPHSYSAVETVGAAKRLVSNDAGATASAPTATSGVSAEPASVAALRQEERRIKKLLKQLLWRDLPQQRGTTEWENYLRELSEGLRQQPSFALALAPPLPAQRMETVQPPVVDSAVES